MPNPFGYNGTSGPGGRGQGPFGIVFNNKGMERLVARFGQEKQHAGQAVRSAHENLSYDVNIHALRILRQKVEQTGRPQRESRGEERYLEKALAEEDLSHQRYGGFTVPDPAKLDSTRAALYWRQIETGRTHQIELQGMFLPLGRGMEGPSDARDAHKFAQFVQFKNGRQAPKIMIWLGPKKGYKYLAEGGKKALQGWTAGRAEAMYRREFKAQGMDLTLRMLARKNRDALNNTAYIHPSLVE